MAFQLKDFLSIVAAQINHARSVTDKITDFQPGSVARTIMEAPAVEVEELYLQMFLGLREAIPVATFLSFGFTQLPAAYATGTVTISADEPRLFAIDIPVGSEFTSTDGRVYASTVAVTWGIGSTQISIPVAHGVAGLVGNIAAGGITVSSLFDEGFTVSNLPITTGRDLETFPEREARFAEFIASLSRGTVVACLYAAKQASVLDVLGNVVEYVTRTGIVEDPGWVKIYVHTNLGEPSDELLLAGQRLLDGWRDDVAGTITPGYRSAGVRVDLLPMVLRAVPVSIGVEMLPGYTLTPAVIQSLSDIAAAAIVGVEPGGTLHLGTLVEKLLLADGIKRVVPAMSENIVCGMNETLSLGTMTITTLTGA